MGDDPGYTQLTRWVRDVHGVRDLVAVGAPGTDTGPAADARHALTTVRPERQTTLERAN